MEQMWVLKAATVNHTYWKVNAQGQYDN